MPVSLLRFYSPLFRIQFYQTKGLLIYSAIPLSAIRWNIVPGLEDMPFSISAGVGFIALFGVAIVLNGIVLLAEFNLLRKKV